MLYYYYDSKEGLCRAAVQYYFDLFISRLNNVVAQPRDPKETFVELAWTYFELCQKHRDISRFFMSLYFGPLRDRIAIDYRAFSQREEEVLAAAVDKAEQVRLLRPGCRKEFMLAFDAFVSMLNMRALEEGFELTHGHAERVVDNLLNGFGIR
jgi:AcrR family transcriptional regulator